jgi:hypothetical protein
MPPEDTTGTSENHRSLGGFLGAAGLGCATGGGGLLGVGMWASSLSGGTLAVPSGLTVALACMGGGAGTAAYYLMTGETDPLGGAPDASHGAYETWY